MYGRTPPEGGRGWHEGQQGLMPDFSRPEGPVVHCWQDTVWLLTHAPGLITESVGVIAAIPNLA